MPNHLHLLAAVLAAALLPACAADGTTGPGVEPRANEPGTIALTMRTAGTGMDEDGYTVTVDGVARGEVAVKGTTWIREVPSGAAELRLHDVSPGCSVGGGNPRTVSVPSGDLLRLTVEVTCEDGAAMISQ